MKKAFTDATARNAPARDKSYKIGAGNGLFLLIHSNGKKYWRMKYRFGKKEQSLAFGVYPEVSLQEARERCYEARKLKRDNKNPSEVQRELKSQTLAKYDNTFEKVANRWHARYSVGRDERYVRYIQNRLKKDIFPKLGNRPISEIRPKDLLGVIKKIEERNALETAQRALKHCSDIFAFAMREELIDRNPADGLKIDLQKPVKKHYAHLTEAQLPEFLNKLEKCDATLQAKLAVKLLVLTFLRTGELRAAKWNEINIEKKEWRIPAERMKKKRLHVVPLSRQTIETIKEIERLSSHSEYVFPNRNDPRKYMSENTILHVLYRMGYKGIATGHGFRHTASTVLNEHKHNAGFSKDAIEAQLAHAKDGRIRGIYDHSEHMPQRKKMMQWWANYLDKAQK